MLFPLSFQGMMNKIKIRRHHQSRVYSYYTTNLHKHICHNHHTMIFFNKYCIYIQSRDGIKPSQHDLSTIAIFTRQILCVKLNYMWHFCQNIINRVERVWFPGRPMSRSPSKFLEVTRVSRHFFFIPSIPRSNCLCIHISCRKHASRTFLLIPLPF